MKMQRIEFGFGVELDRDGKLIPSMELLAHKCTLCVTAAKLFGGYTWTDVDGGWIDKTDGRFFQERAATLAVLVSEETLDLWEPNISEMVRLIKTCLRQRAVYVVRSTVDAELC